MPSPQDNPLRIALIVDNPFRDLPGLVLVAWRLAQAGTICYLVPFNLQEREIWSLAPDFVLLNYLRVNNERLAANMHTAGIRSGVLDTEGGIFSVVPEGANIAGQHNTPRQEDAPQALEEYALTMARSAHIRYTVTRYCVWTQGFADYAIGAGWYRPEQITVTGTPRSDFLTTRWREASLRMSSYADRYSSPIILLNSSFPLANPKFQSPAGEATMMVSTFAYSPDFVETWQQTQRAALHGMAAVANGLARRFPQATFIYRPHPFEGEAIYSELLDRLPNLHLVRQGTVDGWLHRASAMIHWGSSTAIDAGAVGIPVFTPGWLPVHLPVPVVDDISIRSPDLDTLSHQIENVLDGAFAMPSDIAASLKEAIEFTFSAIDGCAHQRVAETILKDLTGNQKIRVSMSRCRDYAFGLTPTNSWKQWINGCTARLVGGSVHWSLRRFSEYYEEYLPWDQSEKHFDEGDVRRIVGAIEMATSEDYYPVSVLSAQPASDYHFGYKQGRAVAIRRSCHRVSQSSPAF